MANLDQWQQVYALARMAGVINGDSGKPDALAGKLAEKLSSFYRNHAPAMGSWSTVWGPVVFQNSENTDGQSDNAMYVAFDKAQNMYVVCIAGTNFKSEYDLNQEDYAVGTTVTWDGSTFPSLSGIQSPPQLVPYLSSGTVLGVNNLLAMKDGKTGETLLAYLAWLQAQPDTRSARLIFSGHSLGGALAPTLALALFNSYGGLLTKSKWANVFFYTMAGPTPGNADFAKYIAQQFYGQPAVNDYRGWDQNVCNSLDAVPQSWVVKLLEALPELYPHAPKWPPDKVAEDVKQKITLSNMGDATGAGPYTQLQQRLLTGTFHGNAPVYDYKSYMEQLGYQHTKAYDELFKVGALAAAWVL